MKDVLLWKKVTEGLIRLGEPKLCFLPVAFRPNHLSIEQHQLNDPHDSGKYKTDRGDSKGVGGQREGVTPQSEVWPHCLPDDIFGECNWTSGMQM